jgi:predicted anti-sigma-YlaC factor YlaD
MMHKEFTSLMSAVLDREATAAETHQLHEHLASCPDCAQTWTHWRTLDRNLGAAPMIAPAPGFVWRVSARLEREQQLRRRRWLGSGLLMAWAGIMALIWVVLVAAVVWGVTHPLEVGEVASSGVHLLSGLTWLVRTLQSFLADGGGIGLSLGLGFYLGLTVLVLLAWAWLLLRETGWLRPLVTAGDSLTQSLRG